MDMPEPNVFIRETYLSKKPADGSGLVAAASFLVILGFSLIFWSDFHGIASRMPASGEQVFVQGEYWRLCTSILVHADLKHLLSNALGVIGLGYLLYGYFGFRIYPCLILVAGILITLVALATYPPHTFLLGSSGCVYFMAGFWLTMYVCLERRFSIGKRLLRSLGFLLIVLFPTSINPEISYRSHAIGFGVGIVVSGLYFIKRKNSLREAEIIETDWE